MSTKISNPLTVIAIFSGLAEAFAAIALINLPNEIQQVFVYFVMAFPILLVISFFAVLNWNHTVLYAPSDFEDEGAFLESIKLKESLKSELIESLSAQIPEGSNITAQQIRLNVSEKVDKVIEETNLLSRKEQILALIAEGPTNADAITRELGVNKYYAYRLLSSLASEGKVIQHRAGRTVTWTLAEGSKRDA
jgi:hypothetical protein